MRKTNEVKILDAVTTNTTGEISVPYGSGSALIALDIKTPDSSDGTVEFEIKGLNGTYTPVKGMNAETMGFATSVGSLTADGIKFLIDATGWESLRLKTTSLTTGTITAYATVIDNQ